MITNRQILPWSVIVSCLVAFPSYAQTPPASTAKPDDTPSIRLGATLYADYTFNAAPETRDADGNTIHASSFNVTRSYLNITGNISHIVAFRFTPDIARETGAGSTLNGSLVFRVKYAFAQINLDDWLTAGSWARLGIQQTPCVDFQENIYRYRFQGTVFSEREGFLSSSDAGASFHYNFPSNYGDVHAGLYNGENYNRFEVNDQKALQFRGTIRPLANGSPLARGFRTHVFYNSDNYIKGSDRNRLVISGTLEHRAINAGVEFLAASDRTSISRRTVDAQGYSFWATPKFPRGVEGLLRFDHLTPDENLNAHRNRTIAGIAYWFPHQGNVSSALLFDYDHVSTGGFSPAQPTQKRIAVHGLVNF